LTLRLFKSCSVISLTRDGRVGLEANVRLGRIVVVDACILNSDLIMGNFEDEYTKERRDNGRIETTMVKKKSFD
jgi:hypothetical protein